MSLSKRAPVPFDRLRAQLDGLRAQLDGFSAQHSSTNLEIGVSGDVVTLDPPIRPGAVSVDAHPGAVRQTAEQSPMFERQSHEPTRTNPAGQPMRDNHHGGVIFSSISDLSQRLCHAFGDLTRALASR